MPTPKSRKEILNLILRTLKDNGGTVKFGDIYGKLAMNYGTTPKTMWEYLQTLKMAGKIDFEPFYAYDDSCNNKIWMTETIAEKPKSAETADKVIPLKEMQNLTCAKCGDKVAVFVNYKDNLRPYCKKHAEEILKHKLPAIR